LSIKRGELIAIQGPSGSGKSTLFYTIGCLLKPSEGNIYFNGRDISAFSDLELAEFRNKNVGFVFQQFQLLQKATVLQNILLPTLYPTELNPIQTNMLETAHHLAQKLGIFPLLNNLPNQLSGGQQQRVAIARALIRNPDLILADEPTGSLDSHSSRDVMSLFKDLQKDGKTVVIVTHDRDVALQCDRIVHFSDGTFAETTHTKNSSLDSAAAAKDSIPPLIESKKSRSANWIELYRLVEASIPIVYMNIMRHRVRSFLTMLGVIIGVAAVLTMVSLGEFTKRRILEGYEAMGVNKVQLYGYRNWRLDNPNSVSKTPFNSFSWKNDLLPLKSIFPAVSLLSPVSRTWNGGIEFGGKSLKGESELLGVNEQYESISNIHLSHGRFFSAQNVSRFDKVCVIGSDIPKKLEVSTSQLIGSYATVTFGEQNNMPCLIIGIMGPQKSNKSRLGNQILIPYTTHGSISSKWERMIHNVVIQVRSGANVEDASKEIVNSFKSRYGNTGNFSIDSDTTMISQMKRFLSIFSALLVAISFLSLVVGGISVHNMMLVTVSDRLREIGLRKAIGATPKSVRLLFLSESLILCLFAGLVGIIGGLVTCQGAIWAASKLIDGVKFEFIFDLSAISVSFISIVLVGVLSGLVPARKAEHMSVIDALRSE
jgi:macrolide transport system ATP-binding/permease protein